MRTLFLLTALVSLVPLAHAEDETSLLRQLVLVSSGSENAAGVNQVQALVETELKKLGFKTQLLANPKKTQHTGAMLVGTLAGTDPRYITLVSHADTVFELSAKFEGFKVEKEIARGPGVADDKGGIVVALSGVSRYLRAHKPRYSIRFLVSPSEEVGTAEFLDVFKKYSADSVMILGFEPSSEGTIIDSRRGNRWYHVHVTGKEAHGADHSGINACHELALKLVDLEKLDDPANDVTVSIGHIDGGKDKYNIVCGEASAKVDTRFPDLASAEKLKHQIETILARRTLKTSDGKESAVTTFEIADESPAFPANEASRPFVKEYLKIASEIDHRPMNGRLSIGSADTNYFYRDGLVVLDGLGPVGMHEHTSAETVSLASLKSRSEALARFLAAFERAKPPVEGK